MQNVCYFVVIYIYIFLMLIASSVLTLYSEDEAFIPLMVHCRRYGLQKLPLDVGKRLGITLIVDELKQRLTICICIHLRWKTPTICHFPPSNNSTQ